MSHAAIQERALLYMKKKLLSLALTTAMVLTLAGCESSSNTTTTATRAEGDTSNYAIEASDFDAFIKSNAEVYKQYVTLGNYKGLEVEVDKTYLQVTDSDIESSIDTVRNQFATTENITEGVTASGDTVVLDYSGKKDGVAFSGGTATDVSYTIGSGKFIDDLDKGLVGLNIGETYDIPCTFPDNYSSTDLAGQSVIFTVTVTAKTNTVLPELTDEWVAANKEDIGLEANTVEELYSATREYLTNYGNSLYSSDKFGKALSQIIENSTITGYPEAEVNSLVDVYTNNIKTSYETYASYYEASGISSYEDYLLSAYGCSSEDDFADYAKEQVYSYLDEKMVITLIAAENNLAVSADEIFELGEEWADSYGYDSYQEILDSYTNEMNAEVGFEVLTEKVQNFVSDLCVEIESETETTTEAGTSAN